MYGVKWGKIQRIGYVASPHNPTKGLPITIRAGNPVCLPAVLPDRPQLHLEYPVRMAVYLVSGKGVVTHL